MFLALLLLVALAKKTAPTLPPTSSVPSPPTMPPTPASPTMPPTPGSQYGLPKLNKVINATFTKPWGCDATYDDAALFLSTFAKKKNSPDLLYMTCSGCESPCQMSFWTNMVVGFAGSLASYPRVWPLSSLTQRDLVQLKQSTLGFNRFNMTSAGIMPVRDDVTYGVLVNDNNHRAIYAFNVINFMQNGPLNLEYIVFQYEITKTIASAH